MACLTTRHAMFDDSTRNPQGGGRSAGNWQPGLSRTVRRASKPPPPLRWCALRLSHAVRKLGPVAPVHLPVVRQPSCRLEPRCGRRRRESKHSRDSVLPTHTQRGGEQKPWPAEPIVADSVISKAAAHRGRTRPFTPMSAGLPLCASGAKPCTSQKKRSLSY